MTQGHPIAGLQPSACRQVAMLFCEASSLHPSQGQRLLPKSASEALTGRGVQGNPVAALTPPSLPFPAKPWPQAAGRTPCLPPCPLLRVPLPSPAPALLPSLPSALPPCSSSSLFFLPPPIACACPAPLEKAALD